MAEQIGEAYATMQNLLDIAQSARKSTSISGKAALWTAASIAAQATATIIGWIASG